MWKPSKKNEMQSSQQSTNTGLILEIKDSHSRMDSTLNRGESD
jgi:hypothetical protein